MNIQELESVLRICEIRLKPLYARENNLKNVTLNPNPSIKQIDLLDEEIKRYHKIQRWANIEIDRIFIVIEQTHKL